MRIVHVPKTIDNDYRGIDFTFGFFTAVDVMSDELLNLRADAMATSSYFIVETMGRKAGWLAYGVAIAGEAHMVVGVEDVVGDLAVEEEVHDPETGETRTERRLSIDRLADRIVDLILARETRAASTTAPSSSPRASPSCSPRRTCATSRATTTGTSPLGARRHRQARRQARRRSATRSARARRRS